MITTSFLAVALFFGGWNLPGVTTPGWFGWGDAVLKLAVFGFKMLLFIIFYMYIRWTLPRFRFDQLMALAWKVMMPLALVNLLIVYYVKHFELGAWWMLPLTVASMVALLIFAGCSKKDELPAIDGYNNSNDVASSNLLAHWTFDSNNNENISNTAPKATFGTVGSTTGQIGKALQLTKGVVVFPPIAKINDANALNNFTISLWVNVQGRKGVDNGFTAFFGLIPSGATDIWGDAMVLAETGRHKPASDTLELKNILNTHPAGAANSLQDNVAQVANGKGAWFMGGNKWAHYVARWNATTHQFQIFGNGVSVGAFDDRGTTGVEVMAVPVQAVFGSLASKDIGFAGAPVQPSFNPWATASIDDVRVYGTALSDKDIAALYHLGQAGR